MTTVAEPPPRAQAWHFASHDRECPTCHRQIRKGDQVAYVPNADGGAHVCPNCTSSRKPPR